MILSTHFLSNLTPDPEPYILIYNVPKARHIPVGKLSMFRFESEFYAYVGSAFGPHGLPTRLKHHPIKNQNNVLTDFKKFIILKKFIEYEAEYGKNRP